MDLWQVRYMRMYIIHHSKVIEIYLTHRELSTRMYRQRYNRFEHHHSKHQLNPAMISYDHCTCFTKNIEKLNMLTHPQPILDIVMVITRKIATMCKQ